MSQELSLRYTNSCSNMFYCSVWKVSEVIMLYSEFVERSMPDLPLPNNWNLDRQRVCVCSHLVDRRTERRKVVSSSITKDLERRKGITWFICHKTLTTFPKHYLMLGKLFFRCYCQKHAVKRKHQIVSH